jgi:YD repeat-containing protein
MGWKLFFSLTLLLALALCVQAQNATYHLHKEASATTGLFQLKTAAPDGTSLAVQSANLKGLAAGEYLIKAFDTPTGVPNASGTIPAGSTVSFTLWMRKTTTGGTLFPRAKLRLNSATGTLLVTATGTTALTSTLAKYTFTAATSTNISLTAADRFYVWVGVNLTAAPTTNTTAELDVEGTLNGNYDSFVVIPSPVNNTPTISGISPTAGPAGTSVTVSGTNFGATQGTSTITFNGVAAAPSSWSATSIVAPVPAGANTGAVVVNVNGAASNGVTFGIGEVGSISGVVARAGDGQLIAGAQVKALQSAALKGTGTTDSAGTYSISNLLTGIYDVQASAPGFETQTQTAQQVAGQSTTTLNFSLTPTLITYIYDEVGRLVGVVDPNGDTATYVYDSVGNLTSISRKNSAQISIIEFTPNNGPVGASVTIYGTGFNATPSQNTVKFNGVVASVISATATRIVTSVPAGATTGLISVTSPSGTATSSTPFTLGNPTAPTITGFTPTTGNAGSVVTLTGTNFYSTASTNRVFFNGTRAVTDSATATTISTTVPMGATSGRISVTTPDGIAVSAADFFIPPSPYTGAEVEITGRISYGESKSLTINTADKIAMLLFDGAAGQRTSLSISGSSFAGSTTVRIYKPDDAVLSTATVSQGGTGFIDSIALPVSGTYKIIVDPAPSSTGSLTLTLNDTTDAVAPITPGGLPVTATTTIPGQSARLTFNGTFGQRVSINFSGNTIPGTTSVYLIKPDGTTLTSSSLGLNATRYIDTQTLPMPGTYAILVDPSSTNVGSMSVQLYDASEATNTITAGGQAVTVTTTIPGQNARLNFGGTAGQRVSLNITGVTVAGTNVTIQNPDGTTLATVFSGTGGAFIDAQTLPATGTYTILVDPSSTNTGSATLQLYDVPSDNAGTITPGGAPVNITTTTPGQNARLTFTGVFGQRVSLNFSGNTIGGTTSVALIKPDGTTLTSSSVGLNATRYIDTQTLPVPGTYTILVDPQTTNTGSMSVQLYDAAEANAGEITIGGAPVTVATTQAGQVARLNFSGNLGQRISLNVTGVTIPSSTVSIYNPDGTALVSNVSIGASGGFIDTQTLLATGTYTIILDPATTNTGSATLQLYDVPSDDAGTITAGGAPVVVTSSVPGQNQRLTFNGTFGQRISINFNANTIGGTTSVVLVKPDGTTLTSSSVGLNATRYIDTQTLPVPGTYTILVDPQTTNIGSMSVQLYDAAEANAGEITIGGAPVTVATTQAGQVGRLNFSGNLGQRISLNITGVTIPSSTVSIYNPDGTALVSNVSIGASGGFIDTQTLLATGIYTIILDPATTNTGSATLQLYDVPSDDAGTISAGGSPVTVTASVPGQNQRLTFTGTFGQRVSLNFSGNTIGGTTSVALIKPDGTTLTSSSVGLNATRYIDVQMLPLAGTYTILVDPATANTGSMTVQLNDAAATEAGTITPGGDAVTVTTTSAGQTVYLNFSGTAGQRVSLNITGVTVAGTNVTIQNPDGSTLATVFSGTGGAFIDAQTLPATGTYTILADPSSTNTGSATLQLYNVPSDEAGTITPGGAPVNIMTTAPGQNARLTFTGVFGQRVSLNFSGNSIPGTTSVYLVKPDGTTLTSSSVGLNATRYIDTQTLPVPGTYTILVDPQTTNTGSMSVQLNDTNDVVAGTITPGGDPVTVTTTVAGQNVRLSFSGSTGQRVSLRATGVTIPNSIFSILNPDGTALSAGVSFGTGGGFLDTQILPTNGTYVVLLDPSSTNIGSATLTLYDVPADTSGTVSIGGGATTVTTTVPGQNGRLTFSGTAGTRATVRITTNTMSTTAVSLLNPDGTLLVSASSSGASFVLTTQTLPVTDTYTIKIDPNSFNLGSMDVSVTDDGTGTPGVLDVSTTIVPNGSPVTVTTNTPAQNARLTFTGTFGQRVTVNLSGNSIPGTTSVVLIKPDGTNLTSLGVSLNNTGYIDAQTLPANGTYTILVDPSSTNIGSMTVKLNSLTDVSGGTITPGGAAVTLTTTAAGQNARVTFGGTAGQRVSLNITGVTVAGTNVTIQNPDGSTLATVFSGTGGAFIDAQTLPATGTYTILADPSSTNTGSATLQLYDVPSDNAGTITPGGPPVTVTSSVPGQNQRLTFNGTFGQQVSINASANSIPGTTSVVLVKPDGTNVTSMNVSLNSTGYMDTQTLSQNGTYTVLVNPATTNTGSMTVQLNDANDLITGNITAGGEPVTINITSSGQNARLTFSGTQGQRVSLGITGVTIPSSTVTIQNPSGGTVATISSGTGGAFIDAQTLPATGTYAILVDPSSTNTGSATLQLYDVPSDDAGTITAGGSPVTVTASVPGHNQRLTFTGTFGQRVSINASANSIPGTTSVVLVKPDGTNVTSMNVSFNSTGYMDVQTLTQNGTYTVLVNPATTNTGSMTVQLNDANDVVAGTITPGGEPVTVNITSSGQNARLTFSGTQGQRVSLGITGVTISSSTVTIQNPSGGTVATISSGTGGAFIDAQTLPVTGTYTILLDPSSTNTGSATLQLYDVPSDDAGTITPGDAPITVTSSVPGQNQRLTFNGTFGQRVSINASANSIPGTTSVVLVKPDGTNVTSMNVSFNSTGYMDAQTLPVTGTYTVLVNPSSTNNGSMTVKLNDASEINVGTITPNDPAATEVSITQPGQTARLSLSGTQGQQVTAQITNNTMSTVTVSVINPDGSVLTSLASSAASFNLTSQTLPTSGTFYIRIDPSSANVGSLSVSLTSP